MIQQIGNTRSDKQLTANDIGQIAFASCLNFFHTNTMFDPWPLGVFYSFDFFWVKRINSDSYQWQTVYGTTQKSRGNSPATMLISVGNVLTITAKQVISNAKCSELLCDKDGEERVMILCCYRRTSAFSKQKLGFFILEPQLAKGIVSVSAFFYHQLAIAPKPGLFPAKQ